MSLWSRLGRAITARIEASPRIQEQEARNQRLLPFVTAAEQIAATALPDEQAREQLIERSGLREHLDEAAVWDAVEWPGRGRTDYIRDRAYRLLTAAIADTPVRPIDPDVAELFELEAQLGRQPLQQAYDQLAGLQPELGELPERLNQTLTRTADSKTRHREISKATQGLVGISAGDDVDPLVKTDLANSIVLQYLTITTGQQPRELLNTPYYEQPARRGVRSGSIFRAAETTSTQLTFAARSAGGTTAFLDASSLISRPSWRRSCRWPPQVRSLLPTSVAI